MKSSVCRSLSCVFACLVVASAVHGETAWRELFNGRDLAGWKAHQHPDSWRVENGMIRAQATKEISYLFFHGSASPGFERFKDFELEVEARCEGQSNSGIFIHSDTAQIGHAPFFGYEIQLNNTPKEKRKTGSLYQIVDLDTSPVDENEWFTIRVTVRGSQIGVSVNGRPVVSYTEAPGEPRQTKLEGRRLNPQGGAIALQAHDPKSVFYFRGVRIRPL